jgi:hypothetical protein
MKGSPTRQRLFHPQALRLLLRTHLGIKMLLHFDFCLLHYAQIPATAIILPVLPFSAR